jgi:hypothetical protein
MKALLKNWYLVGDIVSSRRIGHPFSIRLLPWINGEFCSSVLGFECLVVTHGNAGSILIVEKLRLESQLPSFLSVCVFVFVVVVVPVTWVLREEEACDSLPDHDQANPVALEVLAIHQVSTFSHLRGEFGTQCFFIIKFDLDQAGLGCPT